MNLTPQIDEAVYGFANVCMELGRDEEAIAALGRILDREPPNLQMLKLLVHLPGSLIDRDLLIDLETAKGLPGGDPKHDESNRAFVRSIALDKAGRHEEAWDWLVKANNMVLEEVKDDVPVEFGSVSDRQVWISNNAHKYKGTEKQDKDFPISLFVLGLSRSGKTTAEGLVATQKAVMRGYENPATDNAIATAFQDGGLITYNSLAQLPLQLYPSVANIYRKNIDKLLANGKVVTNTSPGHIWDAPFFVQAIPNLRFVFIKRNIDDLMLRIYMRRYRHQNTYSYDLNVLREYIEVYNKTIDALVETFPDISCVVQYEDMVADPESTLRDMCRLCGIKLNFKALPRDIPNDIGCAEPYPELMREALGS